MYHVLRNRSGRAPAGLVGPAPGSCVVGTTTTVRAPPARRRTASQSPSYVRTEISTTFGIPMNRIRVRVPYLGGGYGAKLYAKLEPLVTVLALITRKPVRYALTREEEFLTITKHKVVTKIKTAIKNGAMTARKCEVFWDTGAYAEIGPRIGHKSGYTSAGPYRIPNVWIDSYCVYTNKVPAGAFRDR